jgi:hypothetical protein
VGFGLTGAATGAFAWDPRNAAPAAPPTLKRGTRPIAAIASNLFMGVFLEGLRATPTAARLRYEQ